jgi:hypothetical protein
MIGEGQIDGFKALILSSEAGELEAAFVANAGMVGCSLRHRGEELLGQRGGLRTYVAERSTIVRTGHASRLLGPWDTASLKAGLHPSCAEYGPSQE